MVASPLLNQKVGCSRLTINHSRCLRVRQNYLDLKNNQTEHVYLYQGIASISFYLNGSP